MSYGLQIATMAARSNPPGVELKRAHAAALSGSGSPPPQAQSSARAAMTAAMIFDMMGLHGLMRRTSRRERRVHTIDRGVLRMRNNQAEGGAAWLLATESTPASG
jgi:hypothetical protein